MNHIVEQRKVSAHGDVRIKARKHFHAAKGLPSLHANSASKQKYQHDYLFEQRSVLTAANTALILTPTELLTGYSLTFAASACAYFAEQNAKMEPHYLSGTAPSVSAQARQW